jgi:predicted MFS family arabinose efflux permease
VGKGTFPTPGPGGLDDGEVSFAKRGRVTSATVDRLLVACATQFLIAFDSNAMALTLPAIETGLNASTRVSFWVLVAYSLAFAASLPVSGRAVDAYGARRVLLAGVITFGGAALAGSVAVSEYVLVGTRLFQGLAAGLLFPSALALITEVPEGQPRHRALAAYAGAIAAGFTAGMLVGGALSEVDGWRFIFVAEAAVAFVIGLARLRLPPSAAGGEQSGVQGVVSAVAAAGALAALILALTAGPRSGWASPAAVGALLSGVLFLLAVIWLERRAASLFRFARHEGRRLVAGSVAAAATVTTGVGVIFILTFHLQRGLGFGPLTTACLLLPFGATAVWMSHLGAPLAARLGVHRLLSGGLLVQAGACATLLSIHAAPDLVVVPLALAILGAGHVTATIGFTGVATAGPGPATGSLASLLAAAQQVGAGLGVALVVAASGAGDRLLASGEAVSEAAGVQRVFVVLGAASIVGAVAASVVLGRRRTNRTVR